jgi:hypothetical protein
MSLRLVREAIRGILHEAAGAAKIDQLIDRVVDLNSRFESEPSLVERGISLKLGIRLRPLGDNTVFDFALQSVSGESRKLYSSAAAQFAGSLFDPKFALRSLIPKGEIKIVPNNDDTGPCAGAWVVEYTMPTTSGWGPLLYDLAIEWATTAGGGLASDRSIVSGDAREVWKKYDTSRADVEKTQLDDLKNSLTPEQEDNCRQDSALDYERGLDDNFVDSPLSRAYRKPPTTMNRLKKLGLLWEV